MLIINIILKCCLCDVGHKVIKTHQIERTLRIAKELSDLIVYCRPVSYDTEKGQLIFVVIFYDSFVTIMFFFL